MDFSRDDVRKVAGLARLKVGNDELDRFAAELQAMIGYVQILNEVDTSDVMPMVHAVEIQNVLRPDVLVSSLDRTSALANSPRTDGNFFLVPAIIESE